MTLAVITTTYNEQGNISPFIRAVFDELAKISDPSYLVVVDGQSTDGTLGEVKMLQEKYPHLRLLSFPKAGIGKAYNQAIPQVINDLRADTIVTMDADFSHNPKDIVKLLSALGLGADLAIGSRYIEGGAIPPEWAWYRKFLSSAGNVIVRVLFGTNTVHEYTTAFRAFKVSLWNSLNKSKIDFSDNTFLPAFIYEASLVGAKIVEVPVIFKDRVAGESKIEISKYAPNLLKYAFSIAIKRWRS